MGKTIPEVPSAPPALGPYSPATEANGFVFLSGMIPLNPSDGSKVLGDVTVQTHQVMSNIQGVLGDLDLTFDDVVKTTIFLADIDDFAAVNEVYASFVGNAKPARSTFGVAALPGGFSVEIEVIAAR